MIENPLTPKQLEYVALIASGLSTIQAARRKHVSHHTIRNTLVNAKERAGAMSTTNLISTAIHHGWIIAESNEPPLVFTHPEIGS